MLAALAGVLLAAVVTLDITTLTLLVINGYAAAMVGRLRNLPLTFVGGLALGLLQAYLVGYLPVGSFLTELQPVVPMVFLFAVLLIIPERRIELRSPSLRMPRVARRGESVIGAAVFVALVWIVSGFLSQANLETAGHGVAVGLVMLSLVLLTGYGGQVSLPADLRWPRGLRHGQDRRG
jgi:branched-chain amino acid transport system permease protein